ncbi:hypothetical protein NQ317_006062 [Molorchus minor]|uniref:Uncharacterized protein n=1 Tax=Molorchus minor TaxID=1323400 RepID=A0ABQ9K2R9_9CUCU|nr:hypothetical protein NQ317_006062 [Molorchus minor]
MKHILILCCLLLAVTAGPKDQKTTLEDIERDYLTNQKKTKLTPPPASTKAATSPSQYGFVPTKTLSDYIQQSPRPNYIQSQYVPQFTQADYPQYPAGGQNAQTQKYTTSFREYAIPQYSVPQYTRPQVQQQKYAPQQTVKYVPQVQYQDDGVQYVTDNSIGQGNPQYYTPQYVYLQQYQSPSTAVQTVVEPKGGVQYVMYIPAYVPTETTDQTQNYENVVYTPTSTQDSATYQAPDAATPQYAPQPQQQEQVQYVQPKAKQTKAEFVVNREPKSLLDSYIPSYVQLQYYRQAQQNSIEEPVRIPQAVRGKEREG